MKTNSILFFLSLTLLLSCSSLNPQAMGSTPPSHEQWHQLLQKHVNEQGQVDYSGFKADRSQLTEYLNLLSNQAPDDANWSENEKLAYWINAYNAYTVELILQHHPLESIKDIGSKIQIPFINSPWDIKFIEIAGEKYDLNNIEHNILRKLFDEPRIHFAIVCASISCPNLRNEAYTGANVQQYLQEDAERFINDSSKNQLGTDEVQLSKIFNWFKGDFTDQGSLIDFLNQYSKTQISPKAKVKHLDYDWGLNEQ